MLASFAWGTDVGRPTQRCENGGPFILGSWKETGSGSLAYKDITSSESGNNALCKMSFGFLSLARCLLVVDEYHRLVLCHCFAFVNLERFCKSQHLYHIFRFINCQIL